MKFIVHVEHPKLALTWLRLQMTKAALLTAPGVHGLYFCKCRFRPGPINGLYESLSVSRRDRSRHSGSGAANDCTSTQDGSQKERGVDTTTDDRRLLKMM